MLLLPLLELQMPLAWLLAAAVSAAAGCLTKISDLKFLLIEIMLLYNRFL
jgi:hypothetical protein